MDVLSSDDVPFQAWVKAKSRLCVHNHFETRLTLPWSNAHGLPSVMWIPSTGFPVYISLLLRPEPSFEVYSMGSALVKAYLVLSLQMDDRFNLIINGSR